MVRSHLWLRSVGRLRTIILEPFADRKNTENLNRDRGIQCAKTGIVHISVALAILQITGRAADSLSPNIPSTA